MLKVAMKSCGLFILIACSLSAFGQTSEATKGGNSRVWRKLKLIDTKEIPGEAARGMLGQQHCDGAGNIYFQPSDGMPVRGPLIYKIDTREMKLVGFHLDQVPELRMAEPNGFAVSSDGTLYFEARSAPEPRKAKALYIVTFDKDGTYKRSTKIDGYTWAPDQLVAFQDGQFLMSGRYRSATNKSQDVPFTAVFDSSGTLYRKVKLDQDGGIIKKAYGPEGEPRELTAEGFRGINLGSATIGPDGIAYVMRYESPAVIYGIDTGGNVVKKINVASPEPGLYPASLMAFEGGFVIRFLNFENRDLGRLYRVINLDGEEIQTFDGSTMPSAFGCYSRDNNRFTFISTKNQKLAVAIAEPE